MKGGRRFRQVMGSFSAATQLGNRHPTIASRYFLICVCVCSASSHSSLLSGIPSSLKFIYISLCPLTVDMEPTKSQQSLLFSRSHIFSSTFSRSKIKRGLNVPKLIFHSCPLVFSSAVRRLNRKLAFRPVARTPHFI